MSKDKSPLNLIIKSSSETWVSSRLSEGCVNKTKTTLDCACKNNTMKV